MHRITSDTAKFYASFKPEKEPAVGSDLLQKKSEKRRNSSA